MAIFCPFGANMHFRFKFLIFFLELYYAWLHYLFIDICNLWASGLINVNKYFKEMKLSLPELAYVEKKENSDANSIFLINIALLNIKNLF